jgi:riboflavin biosynthesis pyrimidine reductase
MELLRTAGEVPDPLARYTEVDRAKPDGSCWVMANMVGGLDGSAAVAGRVAALSTPSDAQLFSAMRTLADVVLVGAETVRREGYATFTLSDDQVATRLAAGRTRLPRLAVVSRSLRLDWRSRPFTGPGLPEQPLVLTCRDADPDRLAEAGAVAEVVVAGEERVDPARAVGELGRRGARVVLCEGGPRWLGELVAADLLDELCLSVSPVMGGDALPVSVSPPGAELRRFALRQVLFADSTLFLRYERSDDDR